MGRRCSISPPLALPFRESVRPHPFGTESGTRATADSPIFPPPPHGLPVRIGIRRQAMRGFSVPQKTEQDRRDSCYGGRAVVWLFARGAPFDGPREVQSSFGPKIAPRTPPTTAPGGPAITNPAP